MDKCLNYLLNKHGDAELAASLEVTKQKVALWKHRGQMPKDATLKAISMGLITPEELRGLYE